MTKYIVYESTAIAADDPGHAVEVLRQLRQDNEAEPTVEVEDEKTGKRYVVDSDGLYRTKTPATKPPADCVDVSQWPQLGPFRVKPANVREISIDGKDYRDGVFPIWSVGKLEQDYEFQFAGVDFVARAGTVLLSRGSEFYQCPGVECLWLR